MVFVCTPHSKVSCQDILPCIILMPVGEPPLNFSLLLGYYFARYVIIKVWCKFKVELNFFAIVFPVFVASQSHLMTHYFVHCRLLVKTKCLILLGSFWGLEFWVQPSKLCKVDFPCSNHIIILTFITFKNLCRKGG